MKGSSNEAEAAKIARSVASSSLVKVLWAAYDLFIYLLFFIFIIIIIIFFCFLKSQLYLLCCIYASRLLFMVEIRIGAALLVLLAMHQSLSI